MWPGMVRCSDESVAIRTWDQSCGDDWKQQTSRDLHFADRSKLATLSNDVDGPRGGIVVAGKSRLGFTQRVPHLLPSLVRLLAVCNVREGSLRVLACSVVQSDVALVTTPSICSIVTRLVVPRLAKQSM
jgi:hypothetical protein